MKAKAGISLSGIGLSALLTVFSVLALVTLALLTVTAAKNQISLGEKTRQASLAYYEAEAHAHGLLARLRSGELPGEVTREGDLYRFSCPVGHNQQLQVELTLSGTEYTILRWQLCATAQWVSDGKLPVWTGQKEETQP